MRMLRHSIPGREKNINLTDARVGAQDSELRIKGELEEIFPPPRTQAAVLRLQDGLELDEIPRKRIKKELTAEKAVEEDKLNASQVAFEGVERPSLLFGQKGTSMIRQKDVLEGTIRLKNCERTTYQSGLPMVIY